MCAANKIIAQFKKLIASHTINTGNKALTLQNLVFSKYKYSAAGHDTKFI